MTTFVLIPGAGGQAWYWHRLGAELERRGHVAIAVDLPTDDDTAGLDAYADTVVTAAGEHSPVVLVAQSMGGLTAPLVCGRLPLELLVLVNAMIPLPGETGGAWWAATGQGAAQAAHWEQEGLAGEPEEDTVFFHDVPADVVADAQQQPFAQSTRPFEDPWPLAAWPDVPTRVLVARDDRLFPAEFQRRLAAERLGITPDEMPGGHLVALSRPVELADRLEGYLRSG
ncbi:alpha/beta hydrolase [Blastococcus sp. CT_GayMR16]|uniref:alpha/beta fold hydrolase n=1 Tax=Blastococcus sp. CT_GayMR16 TaxID=2559607 RepID=UPI001073A336|nr:alpha/beta hydrolase [Blastococcus sp. CT_GayMR16]TFV87443.1 alpha/beta hydrolase [Blastococcus sp. CT_GayMR16]